MAEARGTYLAGQVALVTGASQGIGRAIADALAAAGARVAVNSIDEEAASRSAAEMCTLGYTAISAPGDASDDHAIAQAVAEISRQLGPIDILVNNAAAWAVSCLFVDSSLEVQAAELAKLFAVFNCTRHVGRTMVERRRGRIVNISSIAGQHAMPLRAVYSAVNGGIDSFTRAMAKELGPYGITVNAVSPGATETPRFLGRSEQMHASMRRAISLSRFAQPEEIAHAVMFLVSEQAAYITGAVLSVDGGFCGYPAPKLE